MNPTPEGASLSVQGARHQVPPETIPGIVKPLSDSSMTVSPQSCCPDCGSTVKRPETVMLPPSFVYVIGRIEVRFPSLSVEKEFAQAAGRADTSGKTDRETLYDVLSERSNRYILRKLCWVMTVQGLETYLLIPRDPADLDLFIESIRPSLSFNDVDVVIGLRGPMAPPAMCNGLTLPVIMVDQAYSFERGELIKSIPKPDKTSPANFAAAAQELFERVMHLSDNAGATDEHRALNYVVMRYPAVYAKTAEEFAKDFSLSGVDVRSSPLSGARKIVDVVFSYTNRNTDYTEKFYLRVDVSDEFPFLVSKLSPFYDH